jgi:hypothetical protein
MHGYDAFFRRCQAVCVLHNFFHHAFRPSLSLELSGSCVSGILCAWNPRAFKPSVRMDPCLMPSDLAQEKALCRLQEKPYAGKAL